MQRIIKSVGAFAAVLLTSSVALAQGVATQGDGGMMALAIGLGIGLAVLGGTWGQSKAASAALEGIARNPNAAGKVFVPMILGLVFMESLVLFAWVLLLFLNNKI